MTNQLNQIRVASAPLTGTIYLGRVSKRDLHVFIDKREAEAEVLEAVTRHMQHGHDKPCAVEKAYTFDGEQWWRIWIEPADATPEFLSVIKDAISRDYPQRRELARRIAKDVCNAECNRGWGNMDRAEHEQAIKAAYRRLNPNPTA